MKKLLCGLLALLTICMCGCQFRDESDKKSNLENYNTERYYAYVSDGKLQIADLWEGTVQEVETDTYVSSVEDGICGDENNKMLLQLDTGMYYWDGSSDEADLIVDEAILIRISKDLKRVWYQTEDYSLYLYTAGKDSELISENVYRASSSEDGKHIFFTKAIGRVSEDGLIISELYTWTNGKAKKIAEIYDQPSASADHAAIAYQKSEDYQEGDLRAPVYLWTEEKGEQKLPFEAYEFYVMGKNSIYYTTDNKSLYDGTLCYYDGKNTETISQSHGVWCKIGSDVLYTWQNGENWIYRDGKGVQVPFFYNHTSIVPQYGIMNNEKSFSAWDNMMSDVGTLYTVSLEKENFGEVLRQVKIGPISIYMTYITNGVICWPGEFVNQYQFVYGNESDCEAAGETELLQYVKNGKTYLYVNGEHILYANILLAEGKDSRVIYTDYTFQRKVFSAYFTEAGFYVNNGEKITKISDKTADDTENGMMLTNWSQCDSAYYYFNSILDGMWQHVVSFGRPRDFFIGG